MVILDQPAYLDCGLQLCYEWFVRDNLKERNFLSLLLPVHIRKVSSIALPLSLFFCSTFSIYFLKDFIDLSEREREQVLGEEPRERDIRCCTEQRAWIRAPSHDPDHDLKRNQDLVFYIFYISSSFLPFRVHYLSLQDLAIGSNPLVPWNLPTTWFSLWDSLVRV